MALHDLEYMEFVERLPSGVFFREADINNNEPCRGGVAGPGPFFPDFPFFQKDEGGDVAPGSIKCLPLLEVAVDVYVTSTVARSTLIQSFTNLSGSSITRANYSFPLYDGAAVISFKCYIGTDKVLEGRVKLKEEAKAEFAKAVTEQRAAALLEEHTPEVFETCLGNIPPKTTVKVEISYVQELKADIGGEGVLVTIPTSIAPRYGTPPSGIAASNTPTVGNGLRITVNVSTTASIRKLESRTHPVSVEMGVAGPPAPVQSFGDLASTSNTHGFNFKAARATLSDHAATLGKDFVLLVVTAGQSLLASGALLETPSAAGSQSAMMVTLNPRDLFSSSSVVQQFQGEIIFVADRSGSMAGQKIETLREALVVFLKSLPEQCFFNIYSFGSSYSSLWTESQPYGQDRLEEANLHVTREFEANFGGTEILSVLHNVVDRRRVETGSTTQIILLTDGEVWNVDDINHFVARTREASDRKVRFFALGIGDAVSHRLVEGIGQQGGGFAEVVAADAQLSWKDRVIQMLKGALVPESWKCHLEIDNSVSQSDHTDSETRKFIQTPFDIPPIHSFSRKSVFFLLEDSVVSDIESIKVRANSSSNAGSVATLHVHRLGSNNSTLHYLAAKAAISDLENDKSWLQQRLSSKARGSKDFDNAVRKEGERLALRYQITSKWTSFVAVDMRNKSELSMRVYTAPRSDLPFLTKPRRTPTGSHNLRMAAPQPALSGRYSLCSPAVTRLCAPSFGRPTKRQPNTSLAIPREAGASEAGGYVCGRKGKRKKISLGSRMNKPLSPLPLVGSPEESSTKAVHKAVGDYGKTDQNPDREEDASCADDQEHSTILDGTSNATFYPHVPNTYCSQGACQENKIEVVAKSEVTLEELIQVQVADGSFPLSEDILSRIETKFQSGIQNDARMSVGSVQLQDHVLETIIAVFFIKMQFAADKELWELLVGKAERWLTLNAADVFETIFALLKKKWKG